MPSAQKITFVLASCQYPAGMLDRQVAEASYRRLARRIDESGREMWPRCLLLVGDQVYVDATAGLFDPTTRYDVFERPHERLFRGEGPVTDVTRRVPMYAMIDDHEIEDNWEPISGASEDARKSMDTMKKGRDAYLKFQRAPVPPERGVPKEQLWYSKIIDGFPLFMADTRTERRPRTAETIEASCIMSGPQFVALLDWLDSKEKNLPDLPKFVASPSILLPRRLRAIQNLPASALRSDAWDGYPASLHALLAHIADKKIRNVVFLSGDEHISCVTRAELVSPKDHTTVIHSVHSSPLYAPFPFANSVPEDLADDEEFKFGKDGAYTCKVKTEFAPAGDGFAVLRVYQENGAWKISCDFDRAAGSCRIDRKLS